MQRVELHRSSLRGSEAVSLGDAPVTHGAISPCSELPRSGARQLHVAAILRHHSSRRSHQQGQQCLSMFELRVAFNDSTTLSPTDVAQDSAHVTPLQVFFSGFHCVLLWALRGTTLAVTRRSPCTL